MKIGTLIIGAGPAGLAAAIRIAQSKRSSSGDDAVVVIDQAPKAGYHSLSGA
ncbi:MAG: NAD(P)-binding protein, partial [Candidatus Omnitrophica bacterium]|nr:NAD(P)-binding protein [Candidatus Omnitrophota bacterium]